MPKGVPWSKPMETQRKHGPPSVIHAGLMRTGTLSMARAYDILGLRAHHGLDMGEMPNREGWKQWAKIERAAEGTWPNAPGVTPAPRFKREDWDEIFGEYDVVTDVAAIFADQLIEAYPDAKVVVVQRDFDSWWYSFYNQVVYGNFFLPVRPLLYILAVVTGMRGAEAMRKILLGAFDARDIKGIRVNARKTYFSYYDRIREIVPSERRLEYRLGQGWEPLCEFLGKGVPDVPFPRVNDKEEHLARQLKEFKNIIGVCLTILIPWILGALGAVALAFWFARSQHSTQE